MPRTRLALLTLILLGLAGVAWVLHRWELPGPQERQLVEPIVSTDEPRIRVALSARPVDEVGVRVQGPFNLILPGQPPQRVARWEDVSIVRTASGDAAGLSLRAGAREFAACVTSPAEPLRVIPAESGTLYVGLSGTKRSSLLRYPGELVLYAQEPGVLVLNVVPLETYLAGVLRGEIYPGSWPMETLKAQAVASRTYALFKKGTRARQLWDVAASSGDQNYMDISTDHPLAHQAVNETRGQVLTWQEQLFCAWFHASCGGHTTAAAAVFGARRIEPLSGVPCPCCEAGSKNPYKEWSTVLDHGMVQQRLKEWPPFGGRDPGLVSRIEAAPPDPASGRALAFFVHHQFHNVLGRQETPLGAEDFLSLFGGPGRTKLRSAMCSAPLTPEGERATRVTGRGWGHGVGLCQWGAEYLGRQGKTYVQILEHYYPGAVIVRLPYAQSPAAPAAGGP